MREWSEKSVWVGGSDGYESHRRMRVCVCLRWSGAAKGPLHCRDGQRERPSVVHSSFFPGNRLSRKGRENVLWGVWVDWGRKEDGAKNDRKKENERESSCQERRKEYVHVKEGVERMIICVLCVCVCVCVCACVCVCKKKRESVCEERQSKKKCHRLRTNHEPFDFDVGIIFNVGYNLSKWILKHCWFLKEMKITNNIFSAFEITCNQLVNS